MTDDVTAELAAKPISSMVCRSCPPTEEDGAVSLFVREIGRVINTRNLDLRAGIALGQDASPGVLMLSAGRHYATWLDWHDPDEQKLILRLAAQEWIPVFWYDENMEPVRSVRLRNRWAKRLATMIESWEQSEPWSREAFQEAVSQLSGAYTHQALLWSGLDPSNGGLGSEAHGPEATQHGTANGASPFQKPSPVPGPNGGTPAAETPSAEREAGAALGARATAGDILVVDDDRVIQKIVSRWLTDQGYHCQVAGSGEDAWRMLQEHPFALLISDIMMPGMSGIELLEKARGRFPDLAVLMATGVDDRETGVSAIEKGAYGYLVKPFGENELLIHAANALERRGLTMANKSYTRRLQQEVRRLTEEVRRQEEQIVACVVSASEAGDESTNQHNRRIGLYSAKLAEELRWDEPAVDEIRVAALMHDIGKSRVPDTILLKPGRLSPQEFEVVKTHTDIGASMLSHAEAPLLHTARDIALSHHERWDGSGYPKGLAGEAIPLCARLVGLADVYDALVTPRVYKPPVSHQEAVDVMARETRRHFDPKVLNSFLRVSPEFRQIRDAFANGVHV